MNCITAPEGAGAAKSDGKQPAWAKYPEQDLLHALLSDKQAHSNLDAFLDLDIWAHGHEGLPSAKAGSSQCFARVAGQAQIEVTPHRTFRFL